MKMKSHKGKKKNEGSDIKHGRYEIKIKRM